MAKLEKVGKCGEKWEKVAKSVEKLETAGKSGKKWLGVVLCG